ncbi:bile acid:sodium symporter family protein [Planctomyces sp. SH-PL62]|uniref:bile acid:sodium symporter family protein n=1 Tax=Planctomyces sp. SH-PL62 TaxID=1636152 RepID=UPI00078D0614|nr:bile acid:sodium symporter family protein [Planctomyces sp. SH-PL62]AMV38266.1 Sodium Bile acid symporter family protein [Planctomyces sp. SH-PL62]
MRKKKRFDWFLPGMLLSVALAFAFPGPGASGGWLHPELLTKAGVALIFFLHGVALSFGALKAGAFQWRLHLLVQAATFGLFPILGLILLKVAGGVTSPSIHLGFFYLCALPSTVSSSVAMTAAAKGNVPAAVFNATLSSLIGVAATPALMAWYMGSSGAGTQPLDGVILDLLLWLVLPLVVGQLSRRWLAEWAWRNKTTIDVVDKVTILILAYTSFCDSVAMNVWGGHGVDAAWTFVGALILFYLVMGAVGAACDLLGFPAEDRIAAVFCGSKKTLASGVPMAQIMFGESPMLGLILLPIMVYHPMQLLICGVLADRWGRRPATTPAAAATEPSSG